MKTLDFQIYRTKLHPTKGDDWTEIKIKQKISSPYGIDTYESSFEDDTVKVTFHSHNGLDGKVSRMEVVTFDKM